MMRSGIQFSVCGLRQDDDHKCNSHVEAICDHVAFLVILGMLCIPFVEFA